MQNRPFRFSTDPGQVLDLSGKSAVDIFNESVVPTVNSFDSFLSSDPGGLEEGAQRRRQFLEQSLQLEDASKQEDIAFWESRKNGDPQILDEYAVTPEEVGLPEDYGKPQDPQASKSGFANDKVRLTNYGYKSDKYADYNSNVLKIGHSNNPLKDGVSAALTKSLAKRHGIKNGEWFEVVTDDGNVLRRRYDDTVPSSYKGKKLPETVDLYEVNGSNNFRGTVVGIRKVKRTE